MKHDIIGMSNTALVGMSSSFLAVAITLSQVEQILRVAGAAIGLLIGLIAVIGQIKQITKGDNDDRSGETE